MYLLNPLFYAREGLKRYRVNHEAPPPRARATRKDELEGGLAPVRISRRRTAHPRGCACVPGRGLALRQSFAPGISSSLTALNCSLANS